MYNLAVIGTEGADISPKIHAICVILYCGVLFGCHSPDEVDTTSSTGTTHTTVTIETTTTFTTPVHDYDSDGFYGEDDCDDFDPNAYPGAEEVFDQTDNDCDGRVDADGFYRGSLLLDFTAVYKGVEYNREVNCTVELSRYGEASVEFEIVCEGTKLDEMGELLIGELLSITPTENANVTEGSWSGAVEFSSSDGWTSGGEASANWSDMSTLTLDVSMSSFSLDAAGSGALTYIKN